LGPHQTLVPDHLVVAWFIQAASVYWPPNRQRRLGGQFVVAGRSCAARKYDLAGDLRVLESQTVQVYSLIRPPRTGRTGGQQGACAWWRRRSGVAISRALSCRPSPTVGCRTRRHSNKPSGRGTAGGRGELDAAGLSWSSWDVIQKVHRADQAHSETTDATRTAGGFHAAGNLVSAGQRPFRWVKMGSL
jgi:hypothetical protein